MIEDFMKKEDLFKKMPDAKSDHFASGVFFEENRRFFSKNQKKFKPCFSSFFLEFSGFFGIFERRFFGIKTKKIKKVSKKA